MKIGAKVGLMFTDIFSGWTGNGAVCNKGQYEAHKLLEKMESRMPFQMKVFYPYK